MRIVALVTSIAVLSPACSLFMDKPPAHPTPGQAVECTATPYAPLVDTVGAIAGLALGGSIVYEEQTCEGGGSRCETEPVAIGMAAGALVIGVGLAVVAGFGYYWAGKCSELRKPSVPADDPLIAPSAP